MLRLLEVRRIDHLAVDLQDPDAGIGGEGVDDRLRVAHYLAVRHDPALAHIGPTALDPVDKSQLAPVILTKRNRRFAAVVSADYLDRAEAALRAIHGNRRVYTEGTFPDDFAARLEASLPTEAELADDRWERERVDTAA